MLYSRHMANDHTGHVAHRSHSTPKDFFLWLGAIIGLYASITSFFALMFHYVDIAFPDPLAYAVDPISTGTRVAMATLIVMVPTFLGLLLTIRRDIVREPGKATIWVRRWALVLTIFLAGLTAAIDLITLLTTFLGGDFTISFALKASIVLLISVLTCLHFFADYRGYWTLHRRKVNMVGAGVGALGVMTIIGGFLLIGSPSHIRDLRYDSQRAGDLQSIQSEVTSFWQREHMLPTDLKSLNDPLSGFQTPLDPATKQQYEYSKTSGNTFTLCATFNAASVSQGRAYPGGDPEQNFMHEAGHVCFPRTIDPNKYPALPRSVSTKL